MRLEDRIHQAPTARRQPRQHLELIPTRLARRLGGIVHPVRHLPPHFVRQGSHLQLADDGRFLAGLDIVVNGRVHRARFLGAKPNIFEESPVLDIPAIRHGRTDDAIAVRLEDGEDPRMHRLDLVRVQVDDPKTGQVGNAHEQITFINRLLVFRSCESSQLLPEAPSRLHPVPHEVDHAVEFAVFCQAIPQGLHEVRKAVAIPLEERHRRIDSVIVLCRGSDAVSLRIHGWSQRPLSG